MKTLALVLFALVSQSCVVASLWRTEWPPEAEAHVVETDDGWRLDLRRFRPERDGGHRPVLLIHGIVTNGRNFAMNRESSLAIYLAERGFDVWVGSLRGAGDSEHKTEDFSFDDHASSDARALVDYVRKASGRSAIDWVGHSMGGLVLYAFLARGGSGVERAVTLGSPVTLAWTGRLEGVLKDFGALADAVRVPLKTLSHLSMPLHGAFNGPAERLLINLELTTPVAWREFIAVGVDDPPKGLIAQFAKWGLSGRFTSVKGDVDYLEGLRSVQVPTLVVAGQLDGIAPPWTVRPAFEALGSSEKSWMVLSEANGMAGDYNHMDMLLSEHARVDLYPRIAAWLGR